MGLKVAILKGNGAASATDAYCGLESSQLFESATENQVDTTFRTAGTFSNLTVRVAANSAVSDSTITFRKNGSNGNQTITVAAAATGTFEDTTNTDTIAAGDIVSVFTDRGGGSITASFIVVYFEASGAFINKVGSVNAASFSTASATRYIAFCGEATLGTTEDAQRAFPISQACTAKNMNLTITANARTTNTVFRLRVNGANGGPVITVGSTATGRFEDTSNSSALVSTDTVNFSLTTGTGAGGITLSRISVELDFPSRSIQYFAGTVGGAGNVSNASRFSTPVGSVVMNGNESNANINLMGTGTVRNMIFNVFTNGAAVTTNCYLRKNSADSAITAAVGAGATGDFSDSSNTFTFVDGDDLSFRTIKSATSSVTFARLSYVVDYNSEFTPRVLCYS